MAGDAGFRNSDLIAQTFGGTRRVIVSTGIGRKALEEIFVLGGVEVFGNAVFTPEVERIAADFDLAVIRGDLRDVSAGFIRRVVSRIRPRLQGIWLHLQRVGASIGPVN